MLDPRIDLPKLHKLHTIDLLLFATLFLGSKPVVELLVLLHQVIVLGLRNAVEEGVIVIFGSLFVLSLFLLLFGFCLVVGKPSLGMSLSFWGELMFGFELFSDRGTRLLHECKEFEKVVHTECRLYLLLQPTS